MTPCTSVARRELFKHGTSSTVSWGTCLSGACTVTEISSLKLWLSSRCPTSSTKLRAASLTSSLSTVRSATRHFITLRDVVHSVSKNEWPVHVKHKMSKERGGKSPAYKIISLTVQALNPEEWFCSAYLNTLKPQGCNCISIYNILLYPFQHWGCYNQQLKCVYLLLMRTVARSTSTWYTVTANKFKDHDFVTLDAFVIFKFDYLIV